MPISDKIHAPLCGEQVAFAELHIQHVMHKGDQFMLAFIQIFFIVRIQDKIVAISLIALAFQDVLHVSVKLRHIDIAENLARIVANRHAPMDAVRMKAIYNLIQCVKKALVLYPLAQALFQDVLIHGRVKFTDVHFQAIVIIPDKFHTPSRTNMLPFLFPA